MASKRFRKQLFDFMELTAAGKAGDIWIYGDITDDKWYDNDVTPQIIKDSLEEMGTVNALNIHINSYGGSCVAGNTIVNLIDNYKKKTGVFVSAYIDGIAASMGSGIAMAADYIYMAENAIFMVHKPFSIAIGNANDMEREKEILDKVEDTLVVNYMRHFNGTEEEMRQLMEDESWLTADEALGYGFCDEIIEPVQIAASAKGICINGKDFCESKLKGKFKETKKERENVFDYDDRLSDIGVDKELFKKFNAPVEAVENIVKTFLDAELDVLSHYDEVEKSTRYTAHLFGEPNEDGTRTSMIKWEPKNFFIDKKIVESFITKDMAEYNLGKKLTADQVIEFAKIGIEDEEINDKAKAYDKLVSAAIEDAIKSGIRAKGDSFNDVKWKKILNTLDYEEIIDQKNEWEAEAKLVLKAGKRVSQMQELNNKPDNSAVNIEEYKI